MRNISVETMKDIPEKDVDQVIIDFIRKECVTVKIKQDNGLWTVTARYPNRDGNMTD